MKPHQSAIQNAEFAENMQIGLTNQKNNGTIMESSRVKEGLAMLLEFSCANHKSIKDPVLFSTVASKDTINEDSLYMYGSTRVLRTAVIYGANGSGKSNFIDAIQFVKNLVINSINQQPGQEILQKPHKLAGAYAESKYAIQFVTNGILYAFGFTLKHLCSLRNSCITFLPEDRSKSMRDMKRGLLQEISLRTVLKHVTMF